MFDLKKFIQESNKIDPQPDPYGPEGSVIPGMEPGDLLYDNQEKAFNLAKEFAELGDAHQGIALDLHRVLTKGIEFFEDAGMSGRYRNYNVRIGKESMPNHYVVSTLMKAWVEETNILRHKVLNKEEDPMLAAWWMHYCFECIHPFTDGNGRTGRLLMAWFLMSVGKEPKIILYKNRYDYYDKIMKYRYMGFPTFYNRATKNFTSFEEGTNNENN